MRTNLEYFHISEQTPEPMFDPYYSKEQIVIPQTCFESNALTAGNARLLEFISAFSVLHWRQGMTLDDEPLRNVVAETVKLLDAIDGINYSAFAQFFMVYSSSFNSYCNMPNSDKILFIYTMLEKFCAERHNMYMSHGYTNSILQVVADNYSHKRNSKTTIRKVEDILDSVGICKLPCTETHWFGTFYFLPDKDGKHHFPQFKHDLEIRFEFSRIEQGKLPDIVLGLRGEFYILELKNMKGSGGGQDKQITEVVNFIRYSEDKPNIHYMTFLDGEYWNILTGSNTRDQTKIASQYNDIKHCLALNPGNYFVNTEGFRTFLADAAAELQYRGI